MNLGLRSYQTEDDDEYRGTGEILLCARCFSAAGTNELAWHLQVER